MRNRHAPRRIGLHQRERRAGNLLALVAAERVDDGAGERRLAGAEIAAERDDVAGPRAKAISSASRASSLSRTPGMV